jgi:hypothetical protein
MTTAIEEYCDIPTAELGAIIATAKRARLAYVAALDGLSAGGQFSRLYPDQDLAALMADTEFVRLVDHFATLPGVQTHALDVQLRGLMRDSASILSAQIAGADVSLSMARDIGDSAAKLAGLLDKRNETPPARHPRQFAIIGDPIKVQSVGGEIIEVLTAGKSDAQVMRELLHALRVTDELEAAAVLNTPWKYGARCILTAW